MKKRKSVTKITITSFFNKRFSIKRFTETIQTLVKCLKTTLNTEKIEHCSLGPTTTTKYITIIGQFQKLCQKLQIKSRDEFLFLGSTIGKFCRKELQIKNIVKLENKSEVIDKLDAIYSFYLAKTALACRNTYIFCVKNLVIIFSDKYY